MKQMSVGKFVTSLLMFLILPIALIGCGSSSSQPMGAADTSSSSSEAKPASPMPGPYDVIQRDAERKFTPARFAGVTLVDNVLTIYISGMDKSDQATFQGHPVKHVQYSFIELEAAQSRVDDVAKELSSSGHTLFQWGVDVVTNSILIIVSYPVADKEAAVTLLGSGPYRFIAGNQPSAT